jgi:putative transposase
MEEIIPHNLSMQVSHILFPKYRYRILRIAVAEFVKSNLRLLCGWRSIEISEMNVKEDHIHMILSIPLKNVNIRNHGNAKR